MADDNNNTDSPGTDTPVETLRDDIASAFEEVEIRDAPPGATPLDTPAGLPPSSAPGERARGPDGKFTSAPPAPPGAPGKPPAASSKPEAAPTGKQPLAAPLPPGAAPKAPPPDQAAAAAPQTRAPASWKPGAREHWAKLPPEVQQEVARREVEVTRTMQESAKAREALTHVQGVIGPYAQNIAASGRDALTVIDSLLKADNTLRHGSISEKASFIADIVKSFGVDIVALDSALAGQPVQADPGAQLAEKLRKEMQAQLQPVLGYFNQVQNQRQRALSEINTDAASSVESFATDGEHEFFEDVRTDMADIMDLFAQRGQQITLQDAYDRAIKLHPQVSEIVAKRAEAERMNAAAAAAQRAKRTAASIGGSAAPAGAVPGLSGDSRRAEIEAAWDSSSSG